MRGFVSTLTALWQPVAVIGGALVAVVGAVATTYNLTCWALPVLGPWPAATVGGTLTALAALRWSDLTTVPEEPEA